MVVLWVAADYETLREVGSWIKRSLIKAGRERK
jgi:hypothetical protein